MKKKDFGLLIALGMLAFMAIFSEKKTLIAEGFALTRDELQQGKEVYLAFCQSCHQGGRDGAPRFGDAEAWEKRRGENIEKLIRRAMEGSEGTTCMPPKGGHPSLTVTEVALATGYMMSGERKGGKP